MSNQNNEQNNENDIITEFQETNSALEDLLLEDGIDLDMIAAVDEFMLLGNSELQL